ncbi:MAG: 4-(cytidine 5'-diphospho)-2-C-methyl-D-erythritol kinase, partial [Bacteroidales bacterium]|nr:4-(cytidine 5'-diphospho)-2-C-methyl-D-erythritol kinase [Candidatus Colimorpha onthohippi]
MLTHPNCKINLGLHILSRRADGYHTLESIFVPTDTYTDDLQIDIAESFSFVCNDSNIDNPENLCIRAYRLLHDEFPQVVKPVKIQLTKRIPYGAGLGGGSADAAFTLTMINEMFALGLSITQLMDRATLIGADCPFFVMNHTSYVTGIGQYIIPLQWDLLSKGVKIEIIKPDVSISTREAYQGVTPRSLKPHLHTPNLMDVIERPIEDWRTLLINDFEESIFPNHPE